MGGNFEGIDEILNQQSYDRYARRYSSDDEENEVVSPDNKVSTVNEESKEDSNEAKEDSDGFQVIEKEDFSERFNKGGLLKIEAKQKSDEQNSQSKSSNTQAETKIEDSDPREKEEQAEKDV